jgi:hypothetical protein
VARCDPQDQAWQVPEDSRDLTGDPGSRPPTPTANSETMPPRLVLHVRFFWIEAKSLVFFLLSDKSDER